MVTVAMLAAGAASCAADKPWDAPTVRLSVDGRTADNVSASARGEMVAVSWSGATNNRTDVFVAVSLDGGGSFGAPLVANGNDGAVRVDGEQPPRALLIPDPDGFPQPFVIWTQKDAGATHIVWSFTKDGTTFSAPAVVPGADGAGDRGWESVSRGDSDRVFALWLEHRDTIANTGSSRLWFGSVDGTLAAHPIADGACDCCRTALAVSGRHVVAAWRHIYPGNQRDIVVAQSTDGGRTFKDPVRVSDDPWKFDGCPENGPSIAIDPGGAVQVAWVTPRSGAADAPLALYTASSADGATFTPRAQVVTKGSAAHVQLVSTRKGGLLLAWDEATASGRVVRYARGTVTGSGAATFTKPVTLAGVGHHPALAVPTTGPILAWVRTTGTESTIAVARVP